MDDLKREIQGWMRDSIGALSAASGMSAVHCQTCGAPAEKPANFVQECDERWYQVCAKCAGSDGYRLCSICGQRRHRDLVNYLDETHATHPEEYVCAREECVAVVEEALVQLSRECGDVDDLDWDHDGEVSFGGGYRS
jgi:hypothetical protein